MKLAFLGTGDFAVPALRALVAAGHEIHVVFSQPDRPTGRGLAVRPTPVHAAADELNLRHVQTADINAPAHRAQLGNATLGVVAAFGQKIGTDFLRAALHGCINIHGSLLPRHRGAAPYQWAILNGDAITGVTIFQLNERWDAGEIWTRVETPIGPTETADELHDRLALLGADLLLRTLADWQAGRITPQPQDAARSSRAPKLSKADSPLDWNLPATRLVRRIHGLWSWPAATAVFVSHAGKRESVQLARARIVDESAGPTADFPPGAIHADRSVQTGAGRVELLELKPAGGKLMSFAAFANGRRVAPPDRFVPPEAAP
jgi:methionyl-tRNA formyltransferase